MMLTWLFFFFKQKTAYEMRISDWSSDVCSSDLHPDAKGFPVSDGRDGLGEPQGSGLAIVEHHGCRLLRGGVGGSAGALRHARNLQYRPGQIGRASCRERVCQYVLISVVGGSLKKIKDKRHNSKAYK